MNTTMTPKRTKIKTDGIGPNYMAGCWCEFIRDAIRRYPGTTYAIAKASGVPVQTIDRIMAGQEPRIGTVERLSGVLGLNLIRIT